MKTVHVAGEQSEAWRRMVLESLPRPAWLAQDAPDGDVVLSTRARIMRNLWGMRFVSSASSHELTEGMQTVLRAARERAPELDVFHSLTNAERDHLVGCRLVSSDFPWALPGRSILTDKARMVGIMVNEEDHLRVQAITAGLSVETARRGARDALRSFSQDLKFAYCKSLGYLSSSPINLGAGTRLSAMFHLIGLAQSGRLPTIIRALTNHNISVRGLFGESSRAIGAFVQVSSLNGPADELIGACDYLLRQEREARREVGVDQLRERARGAADFAIRSRTLSLADALRVLGWLRWAATAEVSGFDLTPRSVDAALTALEIRTGDVEDRNSQQRARLLRLVLNA